MSVNRPLPAGLSRVPRAGAAPARERAGRRDPWTVPALVARPGGAAERFARALGQRHPVAIFLAALIAGLVAIGTLSILLGLLVVHVLLSGLGMSGPDSSAVMTMADHRTDTLTAISSVGSLVGGSPVLPILVAVIGLACAAARRWRIAAFAIFVLATESATYRITTLFVHRDRPGVDRLDSLPVDASYPSGHTAASVAVYAGLVVLLTSRLTNSKAKAAAWTSAILMVTFVAVSRMYRGMHHPLDVAGGVAVGVGAVLVVLFACRAAGAAADARPRSRAQS